MGDKNYHQQRLKDSLRTSSTIGPWETEEDPEKVQVKVQKGQSTPNRKESGSKALKSFRVRKTEVTRLLEHSTIDVEFNPEGYPSAEQFVIDAGLADGDRLCNNYFYGSVRMTPIRRLSTSNKADRASHQTSPNRNIYLQTIDIKVITRKLFEQRQIKETEPKCIYTPPRSLRKASFRSKSMRPILAGSVNSQQ